MSVDVDGGFGNGRVNDSKDDKTSEDSEQDAKEVDEEGLSRVARDNFVALQECCLL